MIDLTAMMPWLSREEQAEDVLCAALTARLAALLDMPARPWRVGQAVPAHWYVQLFGVTAPQSVLGPDGHPPKGDLLPPVPWPRRMFAGRRTSFPDDLRIGDTVTRVSRVTAITPKSGRSGPLCFVTLRHELSTERGLAVVEEQDVVYRPEVEATAPAPAAAPKPVPPRTASATRTVTPDVTMLFRYSALTNNAHRIHYDAVYARDVEAFPALVVNGGLTTLLLWELAAGTFGRKLRHSASRNLRPLFVGRPLTLCVAPGDSEGRVSAWAQDDTGAVATEAELETAA